VLAAIEAERPTVPVIVAADEATDDAAQVERLVTQYAENEHRTGLSNAEQVAVIAQLSAFGVSATQIAKRTKTKRERVDAALTVARSELAQAATARYDFLDLTQAAVVAEFEDDPETVKALVAAASSGRFNHVAQQARDDRAQAQARQRFISGLHEQGINVVDEVSWEQELHFLTDPDGTSLTAEQHADCPGHAARVGRRFGYLDPVTGLAVTSEDAAEDPEDDLAEDQDEDGSGGVWGEYPVAVWICTDPAAYGHRLRGPHGERRKRAEMSEEEAEAARAERRDVIASNKAWTASITVRRNFLRNLFTRKTPPKGASVFVAAALAHDAQLVSAIGGNDLAGELLGCAATSYGRNTALAQLVEQASEARAQVLTLAQVLAGYEDRTHTGSWRHVDPSTRRYLTFLADCGYTLSNVKRRACGQDPLPTEDPSGV
jgi:ParB family chromosome partitioning protein